MAKKKKKKKEPTTNIEEIIKDIENTNELKKEVIEDSNKEENIVEEVVESNEKEDVVEEVNEESTEIEVIEEKKEKKEKINKDINPKKKQNNTGVNFILFIVLVISLVYFFSSLITGKISNLTEIISLLTIVLFTITFIITGITLKVRKKNLFLVGSICIVVFYLINLIDIFNIINIDSSVEVEDFRDRSITEVMKWASNNKVEIIQEYEFNDMVGEYKVISQNHPAGTKVKSISSLTVSVCEGPSPYKELILPNMVSWDTERVIDFVNSNYLSNVNVQFVESGEPQYTVIEQDKIGNVRRNEEINLVFSIGEEINYEEKFKLIDFTNKSKFETILYLKQHYMGYELVEEYSKDIKKGNVMDQSIKAGTMVKVNDWIKITISKGPEITVPDLIKYSVDEITNWIIKNKLKIKFVNKYDSVIKKNGVISASYKKGDKIPQGTVVEVTISNGQLKMGKFKTIADFKLWADKYSIRYEEQHEFSSTVKAGEVISYSVNKGDTIKNEDVIIIKISDGEKKIVPDLNGLSKSAVEDKLKSLGLNYTFIYKSNNSVAEGKAFKQSISAGSEVSEGTTITITISTGKAATNTGGSSSSTPAPSVPVPTPTPTPTPTPPAACVVTTCTINSSINNIKNNTTGFDYTANEINKIMNSLCPGVKYNIVGTMDSGMASGSIVSGIKPGSVFSTCTTDAYTIVIAR